MNHQKRLILGKIASVSLSGENPTVRILRADSKPETFDGVKEVVRLSDLGRNGSFESEKDFIESILAERRAEFAPSLIVVHNRSKAKKIDNVIGIEIASGNIDTISSLRPLMRK